MQIIAKTLAFLGDPRHVLKTTGHASSLTLFSERIVQEESLKGQERWNQIPFSSHHLPSHTYKNKNTDFDL